MAAELRLQRNLSPDVSIAPWHRLRPAAHRFTADITLFIKTLDEPLRRENMGAPNMGENMGAPRRRVIRAASVTSTGRRHVADPVVLISGSTGTVRTYRVTEDKNDRNVDQPDAATTLIYLGYKRCMHGVYVYTHLSVGYNCDTATIRYNTSTTMLRHFATKRHCGWSNYK